MRAIRVEQFGGPEVLRLADVDDPRPASGEVVVRLHAAGVNPVEAYIRSGQYARLPELPYTPGGDGAGVVESLGRGRLGPGRRRSRVRRGLHGQERHVCRAHRLRRAVRAPAAGRRVVRPGRGARRSGSDGLPGARAAGAARRPARRCWFTAPAAPSASRRCSWPAGMGLRVFGTAGSDAGAKAAREAGAHEVFDHSQDGYASRIAEATGGRRHQRDPRDAGQRQSRPRPDAARARRAASS